LTYKAHFIFYLKNKFKKNKQMNNSNDNLDGTGGVEGTGGVGNAVDAGGDGSVGNTCNTGGAVQHTGVFAGVLNAPIIHTLQESQNAIYY
jgi:hypothetical protein